MRTRTLLLLAATWAPILPLAAQTERQHAAHEHGAGRLEVAIEADTLVVTLILPAMDVLGFEHPPRTDAQHARLQASVRRLRDGAELMQANPQAACRLTDAVVLSSLLGDQATTATDAHGDHHADDHAEHQDHQADADHAHDHAADEPDQAGHDHAKHEHEHEHAGPEDLDSAHADFEVGYSFRCDQPQHLSSLSTRLFEFFPASQRLQAQFVTERGQGGGVLRAGRAVLELR